MKFIKRPVFIDATQWDGTLSGVREIQACLPTLVTIGLSSHSTRNTVSEWRIETNEGGRRISPGDWIITSSNGDHYTCNPNVFVLTYDIA